MANYVLEGPKWDSNAITWSFANQTYAEDSADPFSAAISTTYQSLVRAAIDRWQTVSGLTFVQVADGDTLAQAADIRIGFGDLAISGGEIGETTYYTSGASLQPDVVVRLEDPTEMPLTYGTGGFTYAGTTTTLYQVILHEIGHSLGLDHDTDPSSIMYPVGSTTNRDLDSTDIAGIQALYGPPNVGVTASSNQKPGTAASGSATTDTTPADPSHVVLQGNHGDYLIAATSDGGMYVIDQVSGRDGTRTIQGANSIQFADGVGQFDPTGDAADVARLYAAAFGHAPDDAGLNYWTGKVIAGMSLNSVADALAHSPELLATDGNLSNAAYVQMLYQRVFGHAPDSAGLQYWTDMLDQGGDRGQAMLSFANSDEERAASASTGGDADDAEAYRLYQAAFGRTPDSAGLNYWSDVLRGGTSASQIATGFLQSPEFTQTYGGLNDAGFVNALYTNVLHRAADADGSQYWTSMLQSGGARGGVLLSFSDSLENRVQTAAATHANWLFLG